MKTKSSYVTLVISIFLFATSARADIVYLTYCPNIVDVSCQHIYYQCTNPQNSTDVGDCIRQPDTDVVLPE